MEKFSEHYEKPQLLDVTKAAVAGWTAVCSLGSSATTGHPSCDQGSNPSGGTADFIPPEVLQQGF